MKNTPPQDGEGFDCQEDIGQHNQQIMLRERD